MAYVNSAKIQWGLLFNLSLMSFVASVEVSIGVIVSRMLLACMHIRWQCGGGGAGLEEAKAVMWA